MKPTFYIAHHCHITSNQVTVDGNMLAKTEATNFDTFLKEIYIQADCKYPKFFKMDSLSKLAFLGAELLFKASKSSADGTALVFSNRSSSIETDRKHQASIVSETAFYPSPAVFVYTLPNIGMGEIAIRHKLQTENAFFVFERFQAEFLQKYTVSLLQDEKATQALCGWVEVDRDKRHGFFYLVKAQGEMLHTKKTIQTLYKEHSIE